MIAPTLRGLYLIADTGWLEAGRLVDAGVVLASPAARQALEAATPDPRIVLPSGPAPTPGPTAG